MKPSYLSKPGICILDGHTTQPGDLSWKSLESLGNVEVYARTPPDKILERCRGKEIVITNKVILSHKYLSKLPDCQLICLLSTGTNAVDLEACRERSIPVCNIPAYGSDSVAEHVFAFLMEWARQIPLHAEAVREGKWSASEDFCFTLSPQRELRGRCLGLLGFGDIAQAVARIARGFGMQVLTHTPHPQGKPDLGQEFVDLDTLFQKSEILSLHCPLTPETEQIINPSRLAMMPEGAVLINTGRGGLLEEAAVANALNSGKLSAACLDVLSEEPPPSDHPLLQAPNCIITPHIAWATRAARGRLIEILVGNIAAWLDGNPRNVVNGL